MSEPVSVTSAAASDVDLLAPLSPPALLKIAALTIVGGLLGLGAGKLLIHHAEAKAVMRVGAVGMLGPVVPLSEVRARAESHGEVIEAMKKLGVADPEQEARKYRVTADVDSTRDGTVVELDVNGPDEAMVLALAKSRLEALVAVTHQAFVQASQSDAAKLGAGAAEAEALKKAASGAPDPAAAASFQRWAGELADARHTAEREVLLSRDSEILDPPYAVESSARKLLLAALGCFAGLLLGLALTARPAKAS